LCYRIRDGSFASGKIIDSLSSSKPTGTIRLKMKSLIPEGDAYRIRIVSTSPAGLIREDGSTNYFKIIGSYPIPTIKTKDTLYCGKDSIQIDLNSQNKWVKIYNKSQKIDSISNKTSFKVKLLRASMH